MVEMEEKVRRFEEFLNERLRADLEKVIKAREKVAEQQAHYLQLKSLIDNLQSNNMTDKPLRTQVDLGCNFYVQAKVPDPSKICVNIGLGYYVEFTLAEALVHIDKKMAGLEESATKLAADSARIKAHIKTVLEGLREMQNISAEDPKPHRSIW